MVIERADVESLCGRPRAFGQLVDAIFDRGPRDDTELCTQRFARGAELRFDPEAGLLWLIWPWDPNERPATEDASPWWRCRGDDLSAFRRRLPSKARRAELSLWVFVSREPSEPQVWLERCVEWLASSLDRRLTRPDCLGPAALVELANDGSARAERPPVVALAHALRQRPALGTLAQDALVEALDAGEARDDGWAVLADELLAAGDPLAESLALTVAARQPTRGERARLEAHASAFETARVRGLDRQRQLLAFAGPQGQRFDVADFVGEEVERGIYFVQLWARRHGPFVTHLLANGDYPCWDGLGVPAALLDAPELRYLSPRRCACITPSVGDLSGCDLSKLALGELAPARAPVYAVEARLRGCDLRQAPLADWVFDGADLDAALADLGTDFSGASFVEARVSASVERQLRSHSARTPTPGRGRRRPVDARGRILTD